MFILAFGSLTQVFHPFHLRSGKSFALAIGPFSHSFSLGFGPVVLIAAI